MSERQNYCTVSIKGKLMAGEHLINILLHLRCLKCSLWEIVEIKTKERMAKDGSFVFKIAPPPPLPEASTKKPSAITFASGFAF